MKGKKLKYLVFFIGLLLISLLVAAALLFDIPMPYMITVAWIVLLIIFLWAGNSLISRQLDRFFPWLEYGTARFFAQLVFGVIYSLMVVNFSYFLLKGLFTTDPPTTDQIIVMNVYGVFILLPVISIYFGIHFLRSWRKSEVEAEKFQKESIRSQLEALKNHLDPHFLFNNLNILSSLIEKDQQQSLEFLDRFAEVYRFILQNEKTELVMLSRELEFLDSYLYLLKVRFEEIIKVDIQLGKENMERLLPPLTLQMLIENVIKHNYATQKKPLNVEIFISPDGKLTIKNNIQLRKIKNSEVGGSGLNNIKSRYRYFTEEEVKTVETEMDFTVEVPLLETEKLTI